MSEGYRRPDLPLGPLRDLNTALHELHGRSGYRSLRYIAKRIRDLYGSGAPSHTTIHKLFISPELPRPELTLWVVEVLAMTVRSLDPEQECDRIDALWQRAFDHREDLRRARHSAPAPAPHAAAPEVPTAPPLLAPSNEAVPADEFIDPVVFGGTGKPEADGILKGWLVEVGQEVDNLDPLMTVVSNGSETTLVSAVRGRVESLTSSPGDPLTVGQEVGTLLVDTSTCSVVDVPALGESVTNCVVDRWLVKSGQVLSAGSPLVEINADKVRIELPSPVNAVVIHLLVDEGDEVLVGEGLCRVQLVDEPVVQRAAQTTRGQAATRHAPTSTGDLEVVVPPLGDYVAEGTLDSWQSRQGEEVHADYPLFVVHTDMTTLCFPAPCAGVLTEVYVQEGATIEPGMVIARISR